MMITSLAACSVREPPQPIQISTKPVEKPELNLPPVDELNLRPVNWVVINKDNLDEVISNFEASGTSFAVYALTGDGYANLGLNLSDIRAMIQQQQAIIVAYEKYYKKAEEVLDDAVQIQ